MQVDTFERALVLGLGISGQAAAERLVAEGTEVTAVDSAEGESILAAAGQLSQRGVRAVTACRALPEGHYDIAILSPGIPADSDWVRSLEGRGTRVVSELEFGASRLACPMLAVTGTKGKSTFVKLCRDVLRASGRRAEAGGNYGTALSALAGQSDALDWAVVEVSSFQLERVERFAPRVGVLLNVQPDHLNRHGTMENYRRTKARLFDNMSCAELAIVPRVLAGELMELTSGRPRWVTFGAAAEAGDFGYEAGGVRGHLDGRNRMAAIAGTRFDNDVLGPAAAAALAAVAACGADDESFTRTVAGFVPLPHRMEPIGSVGGVAYVNDSKATNLAALAAGVEMAGTEVLLVAGGLLKESDLDSVKEVLVKKVRKIYLIGDAAEKMALAWGGVVPCVDCGTLDNALRSAHREALPGQTVLLSPGCASFDQFKNFEHRGRQFGELVTSLGGATQ